MEKIPEVPMKAALVAILFAASAFAQTPPTAPAAACGRENVSFKVKLDDSQHTAQLPEPGKARVYFFSDAGTNASLGYPTVKVGMDGQWAGANHVNSYFSVSVEPGEHHVCIALQTSLLARRVELAHFTAEADQVYYYRTRLILSRGIELLELEPIDSDQGKYLILTFPLAVSSPKK
jgi:hypothetical protein